MILRPKGSAIAFGIAGWIAIVGGTAWLGRAANRRNPDTPTPAAPFFGRYELEFSTGTLRAVVIAAVLIALWPVACEKIRLRFLLPLSALVSTAWAAIVATIAGYDDLTAPLANRHDYLPAVRRVGDPLTFIDQFVERYNVYPIHVQGHPPLAVLVLWAMDQVGLGGETYATVAVLSVASVAAPSMIAIAYRLAGRPVARRVAVFAGLSPAALMVATSMDAVIMGVVSLCALFAVLAHTSRGTVTQTALGLATGLTAGVALYLSYGAPLLLAPCAAVAIVLVREHRFSTIAAMLAGTGAVVAAFTIAGFWILDGLELTRAAYQAGISTRRPFSLFFWLNLGALTAMVGPMPIAGAAARLRRSWARPQWNLLSGMVMMAVVGVAAANASGLSKGEVERIWLPFVPFLTLAAAPLARSRSIARVSLGCQLAVTIGLQVVWQSPW